jgi:lysophospholipase L1-like esterase
MKKSARLSCCMVITLLSVIFACLACAKEKNMNMPPTSSTDIMVVKDTVRSADTISAADTSKPSVDGAKFLALGDSYTIGQSVDASERFPAQTVQLLAAQDIKVESLHYIAATGWTTFNLMSAISSKNTAADYDIVTLLIGVNDQYRGIDIGEYGAKFEELLDKAVQVARGGPNHVFVLSIPDYGYTPYGRGNKQQITKEIDAYNAINKEITRRKSITYIDITPSTRQAESDPSLVAYDGLHPSGKEYAKWAKMLAPLIKDVLK